MHKIPENPSQPSLFPQKALKKRDLIWTIVERGIDREPKFWAVRPYVIARIYSKVGDKRYRSARLAIQGPDMAWDEDLGRDIAYGRAIKHIARQAGLFSKSYAELATIMEQADWNTSFGQIIDTPGKGPVNWFIMPNEQHGTIHVSVTPSPLAKPAGVEDLETQSMAPDVPAADDNVRDAEGGSYWYLQHLRWCDRCGLESGWRERRLPPRPADASARHDERPWTAGEHTCDTAPEVTESPTGPVAAKRHAQQGSE